MDEMKVQGRRGGRRNGGVVRAGLTVPEVIVVMVVLSVIGLATLMMLPRQRENARMAGCQRNLMQIGYALAIYDRGEGGLPTVPALKREPHPRPGPLKALLDTLVLPHFTELKDRVTLPELGPREVPVERALPGFVCPSDPFASNGGFPAPVSYRATTGDGSDGTNGGFAPGRWMSLARIEAGDGMSYTAAFSERRLGNHRVEDPQPNNYRRVPGPVGPGPSVGEGGWMGDAGSSWVEASWRSTLYNHALAPNAAPSCIADDGITGFIGASSGHVRGVNVLMFDGSVRTVTATISPAVWKALATTHSPEPPLLRVPDIDPKMELH